MASRGSRHGGGAPARCLALAVAALIALAVQAFAIQTHVHPATNAVAAGSRAAVLHPQRESRAPAPFNCPGCRLLAAAATYLASPPIALPARAASAPPRLQPTPSPEGRRGGRSHAWLGRGPPAEG